MSSTQAKPLATQTIPAIHPDNSPWGQVPPVATGYVRKNTIRLQWIGVFICLLGAFGMWDASDHFMGNIRNIGNDTVPSILAAEKISTQLSLAHASMLSAVMVKEKGDGEKWNLYAKSMEMAHKTLIDAAQNITSATEKPPILVIATTLAEYERAAGVIKDRGDYGDYVIRSDALMRSVTLPAVKKLNNANYDVLDKFWSHFESVRFGYLLLPIIIFATLSIYLFFANGWLREKFKRKLNIGLMIAMLTGSSAMFLAAILTFSIQKSLFIAKVDAFDSMHVLWMAKSLGNEINSIQSLYLIDGKDKTRQQGYFNEINSKSELIGSAKERGGLIAKAISLIPPGTEAAEMPLLKQSAEMWKRYISIDSQIRGLEKAGKKEDAIKLATGTGQGESTWALNEFEKTLDKIIEVDMTEFEHRIGKARKTLFWLDIMGILGCLLSAVSIFFGLKPRVDEYPK